MAKFKNNKILNASIASITHMISSFKSNKLRKLILWKELEKGNLSNNISLVHGIELLLIICFNGKNTLWVIKLFCQIYCWSWACSNVVQATKSTLKFILFKIFETRVQSIRVCFIHFYFSKYYTNIKYKLNYERIINYIFKFLTYLSILIL